MSHKHEFNPESLLPVIKAEKNNSGAEFTVVSHATGKDYTFKISRSSFNGRFYTHVKVETQYQEYKYLGSYYRGKIYRKRNVIDSPAAVAIAWILDKVENGMFNVLNENVTFLHLGSCLRCGRTLTDQESIRIGLGPVCRGY